MSRTVNFIARATPEQAARWEAVAKYQGHRTVGAWLGTLATEKLREVGKLLPHKPLVWHRGIFTAVERVTPAGEETKRVTGWLAGPFGIYKDLRYFTLIHAPTGRKLCSVHLLRDCKAIARQLAALKRMAWEETDPYKVVGADAVYAQGIIERAGGPPRGWEPEPPCPEP
jgi:hypothetical protein